MIMRAVTTEEYKEPEAQQDSKPVVPKNPTFIDYLRGGW